MANLTAENDRIILTNDHAQLVISREGVRVLAIIDVRNGHNICPDAGTPFFVLEKRDGAEIPVERVEISDHENAVLTVLTAAGAFRVIAGVDREYFTFELEGKLPDGTYRMTFANTRFSCDTADKDSLGAVGIALTTNVDPSYYPDNKSGRTGGVVYPHLGEAGAKLALIIAPVKRQKDVIKTVCAGIDKRRGICSKKGGAWGRDVRVNFTNYTIQHDSSVAFIVDNLDFFKRIGVDMIDFHKGLGTFRQGDFRFAKYASAAEFRENVTTLLARNGLTAGLHTYAHYIDYDCDAILSKPEYQRQLKTLRTFTLARPIGADAQFVATEESTACVPNDFGFFVVNTPYVLIDNELIRFEKRDGFDCGFAVAARGCAGTVAAAHAQGATIRHLEGYYFGFTPELGSDLFYEIARSTARAYNEGGFGSIYLDALDGINVHCDARHEAWYYMAEFVRELLQYCDDDPVLEMSTFLPSMWAARGRIGAWDTPYRAYKAFNRKHAESNLEFIDRYGAPILGWYDFYPLTDKYPGGEHTKYQFPDDVDFMGSLAVAYDFATVFNGTTKEQLARYAGLRRNVARYKTYDYVRKAGLLTEAQRERLTERPGEYVLSVDDGGNVSFTQTHYRRAKLFDLSDPARNTVSFVNPFAAQTPFVRIEALLSTNYASPLTLLEPDEDKELTAQPAALHRIFERETDISERLAKVVRVHGNGEQGSGVCADADCRTGDRICGEEAAAGGATGAAGTTAGKICIKLRCATNSEKGFGEYIIDTDFAGTREFILVESDNGERTDHSFEQTEGLYAIYRSSLNNDRITEISVETEGNVSGVRMSPIIACAHVYEVLKDPSIKIGNASLTFDCELTSTDYIEFDGVSARVIDRYGNEKPVSFRVESEAAAGSGETAATEENEETAATSGSVSATSTKAAAASGVIATRNEGFIVPHGEFTVSVNARPLNRCVPRCAVTLGFSGEEVVRVNKVKS